MVARGGVEPPRTAYETAGLPLAYLAKMEPAEGIEPPTRGLQNPCSTC